MSRRLAGRLDRVQYQSAVIGMTLMAILPDVPPELREVLREPVPLPGSRRAGAVRQAYCRLNERWFDATWPLRCAVMRRAATSLMRARAWTAGFELGLGGRCGPRWAKYLAEYDLGSEAGMDCLDALEAGPS